MKKKEKSFLKDNYYYFIPVITLIITIIIVIIFSNSLNKTEKTAYNMILNVKNEFKNPDAIKLISVKVCNEDYGIVRLSSTNSFGGIVTSNYYINKGTLLSSDNSSAKGVVDKCFELETNNYNSVYVLSEKSIKKLNKKLKGVK